MSLDEKDLQTEGQSETEVKPEVQSQTETQPVEPIKKKKKKRKKKRHCGSPPLASWWVAPYPWSVYGWS